MKCLIIPFVLVAVLLFAAALYLFVYHKQGTTWRSRGTLLACGVVCLLAGWYVQSSAVFGKQGRFTQWLLGFFYDSSAFAGIQKEWAFEHAQAEYLGRFVGERRSGRRCVLLNAPLLKGQDGRPSANPLVDGFVEGAAGRLNVVATVTVPMGAIKAEMFLKSADAKAQANSEPADVSTEAAPMEPMAESASEEKSEDGPKVEISPLTLRQPEWTVEMLGKLLTEVGEFDMLVVCVPLPAGALTASGACTVPELAGKELVFVSGYDEKVQAAVARGTALAAVTYREDANYDDEFPKSLEEAFKKRYVLVAREEQGAEANKEQVK